MVTAMKNGLYTQIKLLAVGALLLLLLPLAPASAQEPGPLGPGWHTGSAENVAPDAARAILDRQTGDRASLALSNEAEITPEIAAIAAGLGNDPKLIFDLVHNHIEYVPTFGSMNGATATFQARRGNDWDQASLLIALLRAAGITAQYVEGDVTYTPESVSSWLGIPTDVNVAASILAVGGVPSDFTQNPTGVKVTRVWVEAEIGGQTVTLDPAFKRHTVFARVSNFGSLLGYDRNTFLQRAAQGATSTADSIQNVNEANIRADLTAFSLALLNQMETNFSDAHLHEIIGGATIVESQTTSFGAQLPEAVNVTIASRFSTVPANRRHTLRLQHAGIDRTFATHEIANKRVSIQYDAPGNAPVLRIEGTPVLTGTATTLNSQNPLQVTIDHPYADFGGSYGDQSGSQLLRSGGVFALLQDFGGISDEVLRERDPALRSATRSAPKAGTSANESLAEVLHVMGLSYTLQDHLFTHLVGRLSGVAFIPHHTFGVVGQTESYFVDIPFGFVATTARESGADGVAAFRVLSMMASALEHGVLEQDQGTQPPAVSAVKMLGVNNGNGDKTFLATAANFESIKPQLTNYPEPFLTAIQAAIDAGRTLVIPQNGQITVNQYRGVGYVDDLRAGNSASTGMIIFGGLFGGFGTQTGIANGKLQNFNSGVDDSFDQYRSVVTQSGEPVEMAEGAYVLEQQDLRIGPDAPRGLAFDRFYSSSGSGDGPMGDGWRHNYDARLVSASNGPAALGLNQPMDAASLLAYIHVALDLMPVDPSLDEWVTGLLATKWAMDQMLDNTRVVTLDNRHRTFVRRADGSFNTPAGTSEQLSAGTGGAHILDPTGQVWFFDSGGRLGAWTDRNGNTITLAYDGNGRLATVSDSYGNSLTYAYDGNGRLTSVTDSASRQVGFAYTDGRLTAVTDAGGKVWSYAYDAQGRMTVVFQAVTPAARDAQAATPTMTNEYDAFGRVAKQTDGLGNVTNFGWSDFRNTEFYTDGSKLVHLFGSRRRLTGQEDAAGKRYRLEIDGRGYIRQLIDKLGATEFYSYSLPAGMLAAVTDGEGNTQRYTFAPRSQSVTNPLSPTQSVNLTFQELTRIDYADGTSENFQRDASGNLTQLTDRSGTILTYTYNGRGQPTRIANPTGGAADFTYNADATLATATDSDTGVIAYSYDSAKRVNRIDYPDGSNEQFVYDANDLLTQFTDGKGTISTVAYDPNRNLIQQVEASGTGLAQTTSFEYDALNRLTRRTDPGGNAIQYSYTFFGGLDKMTLPDGTALDLDYDSRRRIQRATLPTGQAIAVEQDDEGLFTAVRSPGGRELGLSSDRRGLITRIVDPIGRSVDLGRNAVGRVTSVKDRLGNTISVEYDGEGRLLAVTTPGLGTVRYLRDGLGALTEIRTLTDNSWTFANSPMGRRTRLTDPLGNVWQYAYDSLGRLSVTTYPDAGTETRTYDANGNLTRRAFSGGLTLDYTYDALDRLTATASEPVALAYDSRDNVTSTTMHGVAVETAYDANNRITSVKYGSALTVQYTYNAKGQVAKIADSLSGASVDYTYDADGLIIAIARSNGVRTDFTRDANGRITRIRHGELGTIEVDYDAEDNVLRLLEALPDDASSVLAQQVQSLLFDKAEQIVSPGFSHDSRGRRTADNQRAYTWDGADRLIGIGSNTTINYTALGDAATRTVNGTATDFLYNYAQPGRPLVAEVRNGSFIRAYIYAPGGALLYFVDVPLAKAFFYHFNQVGTTLFLTDGNGQVSDTYGYSIFGERQAHNGPNGAQLFTYNGEHGVRQEGETGLYQMRARYYDSRTMRFLSREPLWPLLAFPQALNPYQFAFNNPLRFIDPTGLAPESDDDGERRIIVTKAQDWVDKAQDAVVQRNQRRRSDPDDDDGERSIVVYKAQDLVAQGNPEGSNASNDDEARRTDFVQTLQSKSIGINQLGGSFNPNSFSSSQINQKFLNSYVPSPYGNNATEKGVPITVGDKQYVLRENYNTNCFSCGGCACSISPIEADGGMPISPVQGLAVIVLVALALGWRLVYRSRHPEAETEKEASDVS